MYSLTGAGISTGAYHWSCTLWRGSLLEPTIDPVLSDGDLYWSLPLILYSLTGAGISTGAYHWSCTPWWERGSQWRAVLHFHADDRWVGRWWWRPVPCQVSSGPTWQSRYCQYSVSLSYEAGLVALKHVTWSCNGDAQQIAAMYHKYYQYYTSNCCHKHLWTSITHWLIVTFYKFSVTASNWPTSPNYITLAYK